MSEPDASVPGSVPDADPDAELESEKERAASERLLLEQHYGLLQYYSSRVFHAWVSAITVYLVLWGFVLKVGSDTPSAALLILGLPATGFVALAGSILMTLIHLMSHAYYMKYLLACLGGRRLERMVCPEAADELFFANYPRLAHWAAFLFQMLSVLLLGVYGMSTAPPQWKFVGGAGLFVLGAVILVNCVRIEWFIWTRLR